jgi:hypothetical protein
MGGAAYGTQRRACFLRRQQAESWRLIGTRALSIAMLMDGCRSGRVSYRRP